MVDSKNKRTQSPPVGAVFNRIHSTPVGAVFNRTASAQLETAPTNLERLINYKIYYK